MGPVESILPVLSVPSAQSLKTVCRVPAPAPLSPWKYVTPTISPTMTLLSYHHLPPSYACQPYISVFSNIVAGGTLLLALSTV
jgi:hypothetical protein